MAVAASESDTDSADERPAQRARCLYEIDAGQASRGSGTSGLAGSVATTASDITSGLHFAGTAGTAQRLSVSSLETRHSVPEPVSAPAADSRESACTVLRAASKRDALSVELVDIRPRAIDETLPSGTTGSQGGRAVADDGRPLRCRPGRTLLRRAARPRGSLALSTMEERVAESEFLSDVHGRASHSPVDQSTRETASGRGTPENGDDERTFASREAGDLATELPATGLRRETLDVSSLSAPEGDASVVDDQTITAIYDQQMLAGAVEVTGLQEDPVADEHAAVPLCRPLGEGVESGVLSTPRIDEPSRSCRESRGGDIAAKGLRACESPVSEVEISSTTSGSVVTGQDHPVEPVDGPRTAKLTLAHASSGIQSTYIATEGISTRSPALSSADCHDTSERHASSFEAGQARWVETAAGGASDPSDASDVPGGARTGGSSTVSDATEATATHAQEEKAGGDGSATGWREDVLLSLADMAARASCTALADGEDDNLGSSSEGSDSEVSSSSDSDFDVEAEIADFSTRQEAMASSSTRHEAKPFGTAEPSMSHTLASSSTIRRTIRRRRITLAMLLDAGLLAPGDIIEARHRGVVLEGMLQSTGCILHEGTPYWAPSPFALKAVQQVTPTRTSIDGWRTCRCGGDSLEAIRSRLKTLDRTSEHVMSTANGEPGTVEVGAVATSSPETDLMSELLPHEDLVRLPPTASERVLLRKILARRRTRHPAEVLPVSWEHKQGSSISGRRQSVLSGSYQFLAEELSDSSDDDEQSLISRIVTMRSANRESAEHRARQRVRAREVGLSEAHPSPTYAPAAGSAGRVGLVVSGVNARPMTVVVQPQLRVVAPVGPACYAAQHVPIAVRTPALPYSNVVAAAPRLAFVQRCVPPQAHVMPAPQVILGVPHTAGTSRVVDIAIGSGSRRVLCGPGSVPNGRRAGVVACNSVAVPPAAVPMQLQRTGGGYYVPLVLQAAGTQLAATGIPSGTMLPRATVAGVASSAQLGRQNSWGGRK